MKYLNPVATTLCTLVLSVLYLDRPALADPPPPDDKPPHDFYFGIDLNPKASEAARNLFFETGMNCVRLTGGGYGWALEEHKEVADDFQKRGLKVYMQLGSHWPSGSYLTLTDAYMVDQDGKPGVADKKNWRMDYSGENWPQYSYTSTNFRRKLAGDFTTYVGNFADDHNIVGVILHNEAGYFWQTKRIYDYNPTTLTAFHKWLAQRYGTINALNARWTASYASFDDAKPPGLPPESNLAAWMDWRRFSADAVADFMKWEADFFHTLRPDVPRTTNLDGPLNNWYGYKLADMLKYSAAMDRVGIDIYPAAWTNRDFVPYATDMVQGIAQGREGNVLECDAFAPGEWKGYDEEQRGGFLRAELWTMIGHGMSGILIWGFDTFNDSNAPFNARVLACRDIAHQAGMIGMKNFHRQKSRVALCVDPDSYLYYTGIEKKPLSLSSALDHEYQGFHAALADAGAQTDVIFTAQLLSQVWKNYDVIIMPSAVMMDDATAAELKNFVSNGGTLVAAAPFATMDRWGKEQSTVPAFGLDEIFGCTVTVAGSSGSISTPQGSVSAYGAVALSTHGASVIGTFPDGSPAITSHAFEKGRAILMAGKVGQPMIDGPKSDALSDFLADILRQASVVPTMEAKGTGAPIDVSSLVDSRGNVLVVSSVATAYAKGPEPVPDAKIVYRGTDPSSFHRGFAFPPTVADGGVVRSGPVPVTLTLDSADQSVSFQPGEIASALPVLLVKDAGPLLAIEAPSSVVNGQEEAITVTCFNPSSQTVQGRLEARTVAPVTLDAGGPVTVKILPYEQKTVVLKVKVQAPTAVLRVPLTVVLTPPDGPDIKGVPVDLAIQ